MKTVFRFIKKYSPLVFIIYVVVLFIVLVMKFPQMNMFYEIVDRWKTGIKPSFVDKPNLIPFKVIKEYVGNMQTINDWFGKNLAVNIIMFMPCGFLASFFLKRNRVWHILIFGIILSVIVEMLQALLGVGTVDIDDVILNTLGTLIGYGIYKLISFVEDK